MEDPHVRKPLDANLERLRTAWNLDNTMRLGQMIRNSLFHRSDEIGKDEARHRFNRITNYDLVEEMVKGLNVISSSAKPHLSRQFLNYKTITIAEAIERLAIVMDKHPNRTLASLVMACVEDNERMLDLYGIEDGKLIERLERLDINNERPQLQYRGTREEHPARIFTTVPTEKSRRTVLEIARHSAIRVFKNVLRRCKIKVKTNTPR